MDYGHCSYHFSALNYVEYWSVGNYITQFGVDLIYL